MRTGTGGFRRWGATVLAVAALLPFVLWGLETALPTPALMDFGSFFASGLAASEGLDPYGIYPLTFHVVLPGFESWNPNLNPPVSLPLFEAFGWFAPHHGFRLWWSVSLLCYVAAVVLLVRRYSGGDWLVPALWAFSLGGFWDTLVLGQIYLPLVLAAIGGWLLLDDGRPFLAGALIGLVIAVKPNFLVWPALLFLAGHWRAPVAAGITAAALSLIPLTIYGPEVYRQWFALIAAEGDRAAFLTNASLPGLAQRAGSATLGQVLGLALLAGLALWAWYRKPLPLRASTLGLIGSILASPIAWVHYTLFLLPIFLAGPLTWTLRLAAVLLIVPVPVILSFLEASWWAQVTLGSAYAWAVVLSLLGAAGSGPGRNGYSGTVDSPIARDDATAPLKAG